MPRLILLRHGETAWNSEGRWQGQMDVPLNEKGMHQAEAAAGFVRSSYAPCRVWSSDLVRCTQMADALGMPYRTSKRLREVRYGSWEGRRFVDLTPDERSLVTGKIAWDPGFRAPGGETLRNLVRRGRTFLAESAVLGEEGDVVIVGHGAALRGLLVALLGLPERALGMFQLENASISVVDASDGRASLAALNLTAHLDGVHTTQTWMEDATNDGA